MPCHLSVTQLVDIIDALPVNLSDEAASAKFTDITTDTRSLKPGHLFFALRGERFDGHDFAAVAIERGAIAAITDRRTGSQLNGVPQLQVEDTLQAYQQIARWWRDQFNIPVIAVTGSVGKTTTKELIAAVLSTQGNVLKTQANYNNEIGVPKTLLQLDSEHDYAVIEMAMRGSGQIALLTQIARPTVSVITNVGTAHIGLLGSEEAIAKAKCELLAEMPATGVAVLNHDNQRLIDTAATVWQGQTLTYGLEGGDLQGQLIDSETLEVEGRQFPLPLPGRHNALNYLAALAVAKILEIDWATLNKGLAVELPAGRSRRYDLPNDVVILDETYNAGLESMIAALHLLDQTPGKRHIAVLGTMKELGERSPEFHQQVGKTAQNLNLDALLVLTEDPEAEAIAQGASSANATGVAPMSVDCFSSQDAVLKRLQELVQPGDRLLFKASRSVGLDRVVNQFRESTNFRL
ncbi:UDP-N-acetylmuramoyl-tripeptide--D-alanyl-D-alanine ligase [Allocoleopsis sp.]|uniref:UDP-N-acetylmuramoyl-tripeptide--D-alanyl-D- alanine ligase n=1 Tax=Allocoleopsis sp. TaxID=3088169 RepID=UPI002FD39D99